MAAGLQAVGRGGEAAGEESPVLALEARDLCYMSSSIALYQNQELKDSARLSGQQAPGLLLSRPPQLQVPGADLVFYVGVGDLNSGPQACTASP